MSVMNSLFISTMWLKTLANSLWLFHIGFRKVVFKSSFILLNTFFDNFYVNHRVRLVFRHPSIKTEIATADFISKQIQIRHLVVRLFTWITTMHCFQSLPKSNKLVLHTISLYNSVHNVNNSHIIVLQIYFRPCLL